MKNKSIVTVILSGGVGARLWPLSRENHPKPFIRLADGQTLIQKAYSRAKPFASDVLTVTKREYYFLCRDEQDNVDVQGRFLLEPFGRNTAPAIALAAKYLQNLYGQDTLVLILPADHIIADQVSFEATVAEAMQLALNDYLVVLGIVPTAPETGFGYIQRGRSLSFGNEVIRFVEKPEFETAKRYLSSGEYLWNSGLFCFKASVFLEELEKYAPELSVSIDNCWQGIQPTDMSQPVEIPPKYYENVEDISIDYAVLEKSKRVAVVQAKFSWNDIGSWGAFQDLIQPDAYENKVIGDAVLIDSTNTFVWSQDRVVAAIGIDGLIVIDTPDALLITHPQKTQYVKNVVEMLKHKAKDVVSLSRTVTRPWGTYTVLEEGVGFKIKRIEVKPGASLSLQMHHKRSEHWVVVDGLAKITNGTEEIIIQENQSAYIPAGQKHRLENPSEKLCVMIEIQCGSYLGEDDIVRFDDKYGR